MKPVYFLLVDDLKENLLSLEALLTRENLVLLKAQSGPEALELLLEYDIALAFIDVQMPEMDGFELAEIMRDSPRTRNVPIIFVTAGAPEKGRHFRGYEAGAVDFIQKPIEADIIKSKASVFYDLYLQRREIAEQRDQLHAATEENARLLEDSQKYAAALEESNRRKNEFLATLGHELRNPLAPLLNGIEILKNSDHENVRERMLKTMDKQVIHMSRLLDDLLDISRVSEGKIELRNEPVRLQEILQAVFDTNESALATHEHKLIVEMRDEPVWIKGDPVRLEQIFDNLLNNAVKYTPAGGEITVTMEEDNRIAAVHVKDNGAGIPHEMQANIFELFTQIDETRDYSNGGLGIGLSLVKQLTELHGGEVMVASPGEGEGSTFSVFLPMINHKTEDETISSALDKAQRPETKGLKVLIVDDNSQAAETIGMLIEMIGHQILLAFDGEEALKVARAEQPDVVLLDIGLPKLDGYEVARKLREDENFNSTILIAQTGWGQQSDKDQAYAAGFNHHLTKPVEITDLEGILVAGLKN